MNIEIKHIEAELDIIADKILDINASGVKPNISNRTFLNCILICQFAIMDKMFDLQLKEKMSQADAINMAETYGKFFRQLIKTYTNLDTHNIEDFLNED